MSYAFARLGLSWCNTNMYRLVHLACIIYLLNLVPLAFSQPKYIHHNNSSSKLKVHQDKDDGRSSLVFVFDTTGSMYNDLRQLREGAEMILDTALEESKIIADFVFVPFHDPGVGPPTVTRHKEIFKSALNIVKVYGGGDCPEKSLGGIQMALSVSRPRSFVYVFTDATAGDHRRVAEVLDTVQRKQSQVAFVLTGHCNDLKKPSYQVYQQIAAASNGQVFNLKKNNVHKVLDFVRSSIKGRNVNLRSSVNPAGYNQTQKIPVDSTLAEVTVSISGQKPQIKVVDPHNVELTGPPQLITTLDLSEIMVVKVMQPEPGNWTITVGSEKDFSVKVSGLSNLTFGHGFSVSPPAGMQETSYRPLKSTYNYLMIALTQTDAPVKINYAEILDLSGKTLFEIPLEEFDSEKKIYLAKPFIPPNDLFYIAINGLDGDSQELRRISGTAVQAKVPDVPYLTSPRKVEARYHERVVLTCGVESLVPVTASWAKDETRIQPQISSLQSTSIEYVIEDMDGSHAGSYRCIAKNVAGLSTAPTEVELIVDPPQVSITPGNVTLLMGDPLMISCAVFSEAMLMKMKLVFNGMDRDVSVTPNLDGLYFYNETIQHVDERNSGIYSCVATNRAGQTKASMNVTVQTQPIVQILGPHSIKKHLYSSMQLICHVENAQRMQWIAPNGSVAVENALNGSYDGMFEVSNVTGGAWTCVGIGGIYRATDVIEVDILIKPKAVIEGNKNITMMNDTTHEVTCYVTAKPTPRIVWHRETERFLNHVVTPLDKHVYKSVLYVNGSEASAEATYWCIGENSLGIDEDSVTVKVRRKMTLLEGFADKTVELYSQVDFHCRVDSRPAANVTWYHNGTELTTNTNVQLSEDNTIMRVLKVDFANLGRYMCEADNGYEKFSVKGTLTVHGLGFPVVAKEPASLVVREGDSTILTCRVLEGNPEPTLSWQHKPHSSEGFTDLPWGLSLSDDGTNLTIASVSVDHDGLYRCVAENVLGADMYDVLLTVQYLPQLIKSATVNSPIEVEAGERTKFSCKAVGVPRPVMLWTKDHRTVAFTNNVHLTDTNDLVIEEVTEFDSGMFTCNATNSLGSSQKNFTLFVYVRPSIAPAEVDLPILAIEGQLVELPCVVRAAPPPRVRWLRDGTEIGDARRHVDEFGMRVAPAEVDLPILAIEGQLVELPCVVRAAPPPRVRWLRDGTEIGDARRHVDEFGMRFVANVTDFGNYTCLVENDYGNTSISYPLFVWVPPSVHPIEPFRAALAGTNVSLQCNAVGFPIPKILWEFQGEELAENTTDLSFNNIGDLFITNASSKHEGEYACVAENDAGFDRKIIHLQINEPPKILEQDFPGSYLATNMDSELAITCRASGKPTPYILWAKDGLYIGNDSTYEMDFDGTLTIKTPSEELSGTYVCVAKNEVGEANKTIAVEIYSIPARMQSEESQTKVTVLEHTNVSVACPVPASNKDLVKWYKDAKLISQGHLEILNVSRHNSSTYACVVTNAAGSAASTVALEVQWPPRFVAEEETSMEAVRGSDVYLGCGVDAKPTAKTKWHFNSSQLVFEDKDRLKLLNIQPRHAGAYSCVARNALGAANKTYTLNVLVPPSISLFDVLDVQLMEGTNATLECNAVGSPTPQVDWNFNNSNWHIQGSSLTSGNLTTESGGLFRCDARNKAGAAYLVYRVAVVAAARVREVVLFSGGEATTVVRHAEIVQGTNVRLSCKASGQPTPKVQWVRHGESVSESSDDINYADLFIDNVKVADAGVYTCVVSNEAGASEEVVRLDVLEPPKIFQTLFQGTNNTIPLNVLSGQSFSLHCHSYGNPLPEVYWFRDGLPLRMFDDTMVSSDYGEVITSKEATDDQAGNYTCVARNSIGNTSLVYLVDVLVPPPTPKETARKVTSREGKPLNLTCPVEGSPMPAVMWIKHPYTEINETPRVALRNDNFNLIINNTKVSDSGKYSCIMTNRVGTTEIVFDVTILMPPSIAGAAVESHVVPYMRSVVLQCEVKGHPEPKISWLKDTQRLADDLSNIQNVQGNSLLAVWNARPRDAGQYICVAENPAGTAHRRHDVRVQVPGKWSAWSTWSFCNVTCGAGHQLRTRLCHYIDDDNVTYDKNTKSDKIILDESECKGLPTDRRKCHMPPCEMAPRWSAWSAWSPCSASCGRGTQARARRCGSAAPCYGGNVQIRKCPNLPNCEPPSEKREIEYFDAGEDGTEADSYMPEATYEMHPEVVNSHSVPDVEEFYTKTVLTPPRVFDVTVTSNLDFSERGPCEAGFRHNISTNTCDDIDECAIEYNQCHATQQCANTAGAYRCGCRAGYSSLGAGQRCLDINECEQELDGCEFACVNVAGGYVCACPRARRLHADRRRCVPRPSYRQPYAFEQLEAGDFDL